MSGVFPVRRTVGAWCGMFTDLFIEQVLMTRLKSVAGLHVDVDSMKERVSFFYFQSQYAQK